MYIPFNATQWLPWFPNPHNNWLKGCEFALCALAVEVEKPRMSWSLAYYRLGKAFEMAQISKSTQILCELWEVMHMHTCKRTHTQAHIAFCQSILDIGAAGKYNTTSWVLIMAYKQDQIQSMTEWWISVHHPSSNLRQLRSNRLSSLVWGTLSSAI